MHRFINDHCYNDLFSSSATGKFHCDFACCKERVLRKGAWLHCANTGSLLSRGPWPCADQGFGEALWAVLNRVSVILTQDTGRVREGSVTGIQTVCAQVRRNDFLDQGFQFQIIFSHTFRLVNPLKERKYPRWALSPPTTSLPCSPGQAKRQQALSLSSIAKMHRDAILVCYYSRFFLL